MDMVNQPSDDERSRLIPITEGSGLIPNQHVQPSDEGSGLLPNQHGQPSDENIANQNGQPSNENIANPKSPFIIQPYKRFYRGWKIIMAAMAVYKTISTPVEIVAFFHDEPARSWISLICLVLSVCDILLKFCVSYDVSVTSWKIVAWKYAKSYFLFDAASAIPPCSIASTPIDAYLIFAMVSMWRCKKVYSLLEEMQIDMSNKWVERGRKVLVCCVCVYHLVCARLNYENQPVHYMNYFFEALSTVLIAYMLYITINNAAIRSTWRWRNEDNQQCNSKLLFKTSNEI